MHLFTKLEFEIWNIISYYRLFFHRQPSALRLTPRKVFHFFAKHLLEFGGKMDYNSVS